MEKYFFIPYKERHHDYIKASARENVRISITYEDDKIWTAKVEKMVNLEKANYYVNPDAIESCSRERFENVMKEVVDFLLMSLKQPVLV